MGNSGTWFYQYSILQQTCQLSRFLRDSSRILGKKSLRVRDVPYSAISIKKKKTYVCRCLIIYFTVMALFTEVSQPLSILLMSQKASSAMLSMHEIHRRDWGCWMSNLETYASLSRCVCGGTCNYGVSLNLWMLFWRTSCHQRDW